MKIGLVVFISLLFVIELIRAEFLTDFLSKLNWESSENLKTDTENFEKSQDLDKSKPDLIVENNFYLENNVVCQTDKKYNNLLKTIDNYVQRYLSLFLIISNLHEYKVTDSAEDIIIDLEISVTGKDLIFLQDYSKNKQDPKYPRNFSKLDGILSKIARARERSYRENAMKNTKSFFSSFNVIGQLFDPRFYRILSFIIIFATLWTFAVFFTNHIFLLVTVLFNSSIIWEGLQFYWNKVEEKKIESFINASQRGGIPEDCDPKNHRWYQGLTKIIFGDHCLQYYKEISKNPIEEVSLLNCIVDTYSFYLIRMPSKLLGASIKDVVGEISGLWPWPFNYIINVPLIIICPIMLGFFILILCGKRLRLSVLGAAMEIGNNKEPPVNKGIPVTSHEGTKLTRTIRKLKPWTKSRYPKRLEGDLIRRRKLIASKSIIDRPVLDKSSSINNIEANYD